ncbi:T9SS type A sorting domain-containing protein [Adhaeribacter soli]|uniref:T9SS type A sorting domain-containing protein n=1 Tax=Adhaeribacter soli TaxID=2607655 RepID=A0A5N1IRH9_9BACT|nr:T9SS type A sorting domain-containing protein [Adhaeribacter soli]KAA9327360.1 T9SS type A sorting domain-containing protein [Adhaeribacter soli]
MKLKFTLLLLGISLGALAQGTQPQGTATATIDVTNMNATILTGGDMFHDLQTTNPMWGSSGGYYQQYEVPRGSGRHSIFAGALWIGGKDAGGQLYSSSQMYRQRGDVGYWPGPVSNAHTPSHNSVYDKIWKVSKTQIQNHIQNYNSPGYTAPADIASWPGNGNTTNGEAAQLAPYVDVNHDGLYSPNLGDYPDIKGDQALYLILNDKGGTKSPASPSMNAEIHVMYYGFEDPTNRPLYNTLFSQYRIINRGQINLQDFYAGIWVDFDLGFYNDDFVGCDTLNNRFYVYNGDNEDEDTAYIPSHGSTWPWQLYYANGYGLKPPVQSVIFLDHKMSHFLYYDNTSNPVNGNPSTSQDYYNYLKAYWRNNTPLTYGGYGMDQQNIPVAYMWPGNPATGAGWSEVNTLTNPPQNTPQDRRGIGSIGPFNLPAGQELKFTVAYTFSRDPNATDNLPVAAQDAVAVQNFFRNGLLPSSKPLQTKEVLKLYPNPASDLLQVQLPTRFNSKEAKIIITDNLGRTVLAAKVHQGENTVHLNIASLSKGIYQVSVTSENHTATGRLVKQ